MNFKNSIVYSFIVFSSITFAQDNTIIISGTVTDSLQQPLNNVTLIAKPKQEKIKIKYAISDNNGYYKLQLIEGVRYELNISHLGYNSINQEVSFLENNTNYNFKLNTKNESLDEVIIDYKYQPIKKKQRYYYL